MGGGGGGINIRWFDGASRAFGQVIIPAKPRGGDRKRACGPYTVYHASTMTREYKTLREAYRAARDHMLWRVRMASHLDD